MGREMIRGRRRGRPRSRRPEDGEASKGHIWSVNWPVTTLSPAVWDDCLPDAVKVIATLSFVSLYSRKPASFQDTTESVEIAIDRRVNLGDWESCGTFEIAGKSRARFSRSVSIDRPPNAAGQEWGFRLRRVTPDVDPAKHSKFYLHSVQQEGHDGRFLAQPAEG